MQALVRSRRAVANQAWQSVERDIDRKICASLALPIGYATQPLRCGRVGRSTRDGRCSNTKACRRVAMKKPPRFYLRRKAKARRSAVSGTRRKRNASVTRRPLHRRGRMGLQRRYFSSRRDARIISPPEPWWRRTTSTVDILTHTCRSCCAVTERRSGMSADYGGQVGP